MPLTELEQRITNEAISDLGELGNIMIGVQEVPQSQTQVVDFAASLAITPTSLGDMEVDLTEFASYETTNDPSFVIEESIEVKMSVNDMLTAINKALVTNYKDIAVEKAIARLLAAVEEMGQLP